MKSELVVVFLALILCSCESVEQSIARSKGERENTENSLLQAMPNRSDADLLQHRGNLAYLGTRSDDQYFGKLDDEIRRRNIFTNEEWELVNNRKSRIGC